MKNLKLKVISDEEALVIIKKYIRYFKNPFGISDDTRISIYLTKDYYEENFKKLLSWIHQVEKETNEQCSCRSDEEALHIIKKAIRNKRTIRIDDKCIAIKIYKIHDEENFEKLLSWVHKVEKERGWKL